MRSCPRSGDPQERIPAARSAPAAGQIPEGAHCTPRSCRPRSSPDLQHVRLPRPEPDVVPPAPLVALAGQRVHGVERGRAGRGRDRGCRGRRGSRTGSRLRRRATTSSPSDRAKARRCSVSVSSQVSRSSPAPVSAGCARRTSLSRLTSGKSGPSRRRSRGSYFSESRYSSLPGAHGHVLERLVARVDPVARRERRREHEPALERGPPALLQGRVEDVRRVRPQVRPEERRPLAELLDELDELRLRVLPGEVRVRLREAGLGEQGHHRRTRERLGEEHRLGVLRSAPRRSATPRTGPASCAGCRRGTPSRPRRTSGARRRGPPSRAPRGQRVSQSKLWMSW